MGKIYISVEGGCVRGVWSTDKRDKVSLWDWDNIEAGDIDEIDFDSPDFKPEDLDLAIKRKGGEFENIIEELYPIF